MSDQDESAALKPKPWKLGLAILLVGGLASLTIPERWGKTALSVALFVGWSLVVQGDGSLSERLRQRRWPIAIGALFTTLVVTAFLFWSGTFARFGWVEGPRRPIAGYSFGMSRAEFESTCTAAGSIHTDATWQGVERVACTGRIDNPDVDAEFWQVEGWLCGDEICVLKFVSYEAGDFERIASQVETFGGAGEADRVRIEHGEARLFRFGEPFAPSWIRVTGQRVEENDYVFLMYMRADAMHWVGG